MFGRVETVNKAIFVIELNPLQSVVKSGHQALHSPTALVAGFRTLCFQQIPQFVATNLNENDP